MLRLLQPRLLIGLAIAGCVVGVVLLYAGFPRLGPIGLFVGVFATILAAIMIATPEDRVQAARSAMFAPTPQAHVVADTAPPADLSDQPPTETTQRADDREQVSAPTDPAAE